MMFRRCSACSAQEVNETELRDYQQTLYESTRKAFRNGKRVLVVAPCGAGKSYIFSAMAQNTKGDVLVLVHRRELKEQH